MIEALDLGARLVHGIGAALWIGSIYFSATALHQRAPKLFERPADFERFITALTDGNRARHMLAASSCLISGIILLFTAPHLSHTQLISAAIKGLLWSGACVTIGYISWRLWPERIFALEQELPEIKARGARARWAVLMMLILAAALGYAISHAPSG